MIDVRFHPKAALALHGPAPAIASRDMMTHGLFSLLAATFLAAPQLDADWTHSEPGDAQLEPSDESDAGDATEEASEPELPRAPVRVPARMQSKPVERPNPIAAPALQIERRWYGWQTLLVSGASMFTM